MDTWREGLKWVLQTGFFWAAGTKQSLLEFDKNSTSFPRWNEKCQYELKWMNLKQLETVMDIECEKIHRSYRGGAGYKKMVGPLYIGVINLGFTRSKLDSLWIALEKIGGGLLAPPGPPPPVPPPLSYQVLIMHNLNFFYWFFLAIAK